MPPANRCEERLQSLPSLNSAKERFGVAPVLAVRVAVHPVKDGDQAVGRVEGGLHRPVDVTADVDLFPRREAVGCRATLEPAQDVEAFSRIGDQPDLTERAQ